MEDKIKVLFISSGDYKYGATKSMYELLLRLKEYNNVVPIVLTKIHNPINEQCNKAGIENYSFWSRDIMAGSAYSNPLLNAAKHIVKYALYSYGRFTRHRINKIGIDFSSIDLIHTNLNRNDIGAYIAKKYNIPHIWHFRELGKEDYRVHFYKRNCIDYLNDNADTFIAISKCVKQAWVDRGIQKDKIKVVYNGIDTTNFIEKKVHKDDKIKIVMTGHIQLTKGQDQLIRAVACLNENLQHKIQVDFLGEAYPDYQKKLNHFIVKNNLENIIHFQGYCDHVPQKLSEYDIGIVCSKAEGFGRVTAEYMAAGLLVIASDTGANPELIDNNKNGLLYSYGNVKDLAKQIESVVMNPNIIKKYGQSAKSYALRNFNIDRCADEIYAIYQDTVSAFRSTNANIKKE